MPIAYSRGLMVLAVLIVASACADKRPQPGFVSNAQTGSTLAIAREVAQSAPDGYFIEFRSRYALSYGHTYTVFGRIENGKMVNPEVAGLHPASNSEVPYVLGHFVPVPAETGWSDGDLEEEYRSASWRVMLTEAQYRDLIPKIRKIQDTSHVWHAGVYNCNAFTASIARSMGYKTPSIHLRPQQFITTLREINTSA